MFNKGENGSLARFLEGISPSSEVWLVGGDFNIVREAGERLGGNGIDFSAVNEFNDRVSQSGIMEFDIVGSKYTWQQSGRQMWQKLDRYFCVISSGRVFLVSALCIICVEKILIMLPLLGKFGTYHGGSQGCFKFQTMWSNHH